MIGLGFDKNAVCKVVTITCAQMALWKTGRERNLQKQAQESKRILNRSIVIESLHFCKLSLQQIGLPDNVYARSFSELIFCNCITCLQFVFPEMFLQIVKIVIYSVVQFFALQVL